VAYRDSELINCGDARNDDRVEKKEKAEEMGFRSGLLVPLSYKNQTFGVLKVISRQPFFFEESDESTLRLLSGLLSSQIYHAIQFEDIRLEAGTDELTGINNRRRLMSDLNEELDRSDRYDHELSLMFIDLDHFKLINDSHGHVVGDQVLREIGTILEEETRTADIIGRYGGEEFILATPEVDLEGARELAERIRMRLRRTDFSGNEGDPFTVTCSVGLTSYGGTESVDELIERADDALYEAKKNGRDQIQTLTPSEP
jgi:diguanylate cyclase (GGDEF)-like protein